VTPADGPPAAVAVAVTSDAYGGAEKCLIDLYGHPRTLAEFAGTLVGSMPGWERTGRPTRPAGTAHKWGRGAGMGEIARLPRSVRQGRDAIAGVRPALVHLSFKREQVLLTAAAAAIAPVLWTEHGALPRGRRWQTLEPLYRRAARHVAAIICVGPHVAGDVAAALGRRAPPIHLIENAIDLPRHDVAGPAERDAARERLGLTPGALVLASTARLAPAKRVGLVMDAAACIPGAVALVCGDGPDRAQLECRASARSTVFTGFLDDPRDVYRAADVLVHPTNGAGEGLPFTLLEAAASGLPSVVCADSGLSAVVDGWGAVATHASGAAIAVAALTLDGDEVRGSARAWAGRHAMEPWIDAHLAVLRVAVAP